MDAEHLIKSIVRSIMFFAGMAGNNWLALICLPKEKCAIRTNEILLLNLAVSNLITNYLVDLPDTIADFAGPLFMGETFCSVFRFCADLSETSSLYTTLFISTFWNQKLVGSLRRGGAPVQMDNLWLVAGLLAGSWTVSVAFSMPHFFFVSLSLGKKNYSYRECLDFFPIKAYDIIFLVLANAFPLTGILFTSIQIVKALLKKQKRIQSNGPEPSRDKNIQSNTSLSSLGANSSNNVKKSPFPNKVCSGESTSSNSNKARANKSPRTSPNKETPSNSARPKIKQPPSKARPNSNTQVRAAKSVLAVASVVLLCWTTHLLLRITNNIQTLSILLELAGYVGASYTCIIPYIFLHGMKRASCCCKR